MFCLSCLNMFFEFSDDFKIIKFFLVFSKLTIENVVYFSMIFTIHSIQNKKMLKNHVMIKFCPQNSKFMLISTRG